MALTGSLCFLLGLATVALSQASELTIRRQPGTQIKNESVTIPFVAEAPVKQCNETDRVCGQIADRQLPGGEEPLGRLTVKDDIVEEDGVFTAPFLINVLTFKERLNSVFSDIQFTMEEEENNQLAFLDVLVCRKDCGGLKTRVFRKATNTTQILNFNSNHPISHKRSCVRTLYRRVETHCSEPEDKVAESQYLRRVFRENGYPRNFVNRCMRKRDERQNRADPKFWRAIPYIKNVSGAVSRLLAPLGVGVAHRPEATMRRQVMRPKDPLPRQETSGVVYRIWCSCGQSNYVGETGRLLRTRIAEHVAAVRRNDANSQVAAHSTRPGHTFKFAEAEILARGDNRVSRELLESWFTGPQSINKCNDIPIPYSVLRHRLAKAIDHSGRAQAGEPDGRAIITPASNTGDEITAINNLHAGHQAISAPAGNNP
ncbi:hypothetical protein SprV_0602137200 [Sparganum proliferum]